MSSGDKIAQVIGPVVDVLFQQGKHFLRLIMHLSSTKWRKKTKIVLEAAFGVG